MKQELFKFKSPRFLWLRESCQVIKTYPQEQAYHELKDAITFSKLPSDDPNRIEKALSYVELRSHTTEDEQPLPVAATGQLFIFVFVHHWLFFF